MPIYSFHFRSASGDLWPDPVGSDLVDDEAATLEALLSADELSRDRSEAFAVCAFEIHDEGGWLVDRVPFRRQ